MRLFLAIFPPKSYLDYFRDVMREFNTQQRNLEPANLEQMHLTIRFVGAKVSDISKNLLVEELRKRKGQFPKPTIEIEKLSFGFPRQHDPRVVIAVIKKNPELKHLVDDLHKIIRSQGLDDTILWKQHMDSDQHISITRLKQSRSRSTGREIKEIVSNIHIPTPPAFVAEELFIMQSVLKSDGPVYKKIEKIEL